MPLIIAAVLYGSLLTVAMLIIGGLWLVQGRMPAMATLSALGGSIVGFVLGCIAGVLICLTGSSLGSQVGATAIVVVASLGLALVGMLLGAWLWGSPQKVTL